MTARDTDWTNQIGLSAELTRVARWLRSHYQDFAVTADGCLAMDWRTERGAGGAVRTVNGGTVLLTTVAETKAFLGY